MFTESLNCRTHGECQSEFPVNTNHWWKVCPGAVPKNTSERWSDFGMVWKPTSVRFHSPGEDLMLNSSVHCWESLCPQVHRGKYKSEWLGKRNEGLFHFLLPCSEPCKSQENSKRLQKSLRAAKGMYILKYRCYCSVGGQGRIPVLTYIHVSFTV